MFTKSLNMINTRNSSLGEQVERRVLKVLYVVFGYCKTQMLVSTLETPQQCLNYTLHETSLNAALRSKILLSKTTAAKISTHISNHFNVDSLDNSFMVLTRSCYLWMACPSHS